MSYVPPPEITDTSAWRTDDERWVAERARQWVALEKWLKFSSHTVHDIKMLRAYYLTGRMQPGNTKYRNETVPAMPLLFRLWFHPDSSARNWAKQIRFTVWSDYWLSVGAFQTANGPWGADFNGLERPIFDALLGGRPVRSFLDRDKYRIGRRVWTKLRIADQYGPVDSVIANLLPILQGESDRVRSYVRHAAQPAFLYGDAESWSSAVEGPSAKRDLVPFLEAVNARSKEKLRKGNDLDAERIALARELAALFDKGVGPERFRELWREQRGGGTRSAAKARTTTKKKTNAKPAKRKA